MKKQAPPERKSDYQNTKLVRTRQELMASPGEWFLYEQGAATSTAYGKTSVVGKLLAEGGFERRCVHVASGRVDIYVRYVGEGA